MRKVFLALVITLIVITAAAQTGTTINVNTPGSLISLIDKTNADTITILKLKGNIDARDIYFLRDSMLVLAKLDLEEVHIMAFENRPADVMPDYSFRDSLKLAPKKSLKSIKFPNNLRAIGNCAFYGCDGLSGNLIIPNSVIEIGAAAFSGCNGFSGNLILPNSIKVIRDAAFRECSGFNGNLILPNKVISIGNYAFYYCSNLSGNLSLTNSIKQIGYYAFCGCAGFTGDLIIPNSLTSINDAAFGACSGLTGNLVIPNSVRYIRNAAFQGCSGFTGNLIIPNSVTGIGWGAFEDCSGLTGNLIIPNSVTEIGKFAFKNCSSFTGSLIIPNPVAALEYQTFQNCSGLTSIVIPSLVDSIADEVFKGCSGLQKIISVNTTPLILGVNTFDGIDKSTCELVVPSGSKASYQLADYWKDFMNIKDNTIFLSFNSQNGSGVADTIVDYNTLIKPPVAPKKAGNTFSGWYKEVNCINPWDFSIDKVTENTKLFAKWNYSPIIINVPVAGGLGEAIVEAGLNAETLDNIKITGNIDCRDVYYMRDSIPFLTLIDLESANIVAYGNSPANEMPDNSFFQPTFLDIKASLTSIKLPKNITSIGDFAFYMCSGLRGNLSIPNSVNKIGDDAFSRCVGLSGTLILSDSITSIGIGAFESCQGMNGNLILPNSLTSIGAAAFSNCTGFSGNLTIPNSVTSINAIAFNGWVGMDNLFIPSSITSIEFGAFMNCSNLQKITVGLSVPLNIEDYTFFQLNKSSCELVVPVGSIAAYQTADYWKDFTHISEAIFCYYNTQGGSALADTIVNYNTSIPYSSVPTRIGYTFEGWYKEANCTNAWVFATDVVTTNTTLYAKWTINNYLVTFDSQGGSSVSNVNTNYNTTITSPTFPTRTGYTFEGWYKDPACINAWNFTADKVVANTNLYARWTINNYTVAFDSQGGSSVSNINANYNTTISIPTIPARTGYTFEGWYKESACVNAWNSITDKVVTNTNLYAQWIINNYTVAFDSQGGSSVDNINANYNTTISIPTIPARTGYTFEGWYTESACVNAWSFTTDKVVANTNLYAQWIINNYTVAFDSQGGSSVANINANYNTTISIPTIPARAGYTFEGWYKESACVNAWSFTTDVVNVNTTLFAKWVDIISSINNSSIQEFRLYPNPSSDVVILEGSNIQQATIINLIGVVVMQVSFQVKETKTINLSQLKAGTYFIHVKMIDNNNKILKLVKDN